VIEAMLCLSPVVSTRQLRPLGSVRFIHHTIADPPSWPCCSPNVPHPQMEEYVFQAKLNKLVECVRKERDSDPDRK
jgi:hypothetical protein